MRKETEKVVIFFTGLSMFIQSALNHTVQTLRAKYYMLYLFSTYSTTTLLLLRFEAHVVIEAAICKRCQKMFMFFFQWDNIENLYSENQFPWEELALQRCKKNNSSHTEGLLL